MNQRSAYTQVAGLGTIMGVWAHPDDETFGSAGLMKLARDNGQQVICVTATKGELGVQDETRWPAADLAEIRAIELHRVLELLGVEIHHWLGYTDGTCNQVGVAATAQLADLVARYKPDSIITFPPDGITGHPDHRAVSSWVHEIHDAAAVYYAVESREQYEAYWRELDARYNIYYNVDEPVTVPQAECDLLLKLPGVVCDAKFAALQAMPSQTAALLSEIDAESARELFCTEAYVSASRRDEFWGGEVI